jgi:hypothetical protein
MERLDKLSRLAQEFIAKVAIPIGVGKWSISMLRATICAVD